ncbi:MAG TPA: hypothetical protein VFA58_05025, partial [Chthoniobacterales bacterium]|nr:hypothetical protein [Chthoniobacterales bacterium]
MKLGILENGTALVQNLVPESLANVATSLVPQGLANVATRLVEAIAINSISEKVRRNRTLVVKRRNLHSEQLADLTNLYFRVAGIPIRFWSTVEDWQRWEIDCYNMLNGDHYKAYASGGRTVIAEKLPGESLWQYLNRGTLTRRMLIAAATEFRRAHEFWTDEFRGCWSHGDASITNVIYNASENRARLIDFEIYHEKSLSAAARQADDLLVFLLDLVGTLPTRQWIPFATTFLQAYGNGEVIAQLREQLDLPGGLAWIWWGVRTNFTNPAKVKRRLANLSRAIAKMKLQEAASARVRSKRRPSINCHPIKPGIPKPSSRTRTIKERAKAVSPGIPRRL